MLWRSALGEEEGWFFAAFGGFINHRVREVKGVAAFGGFFKHRGREVKGVAGFGGFSSLNLLSSVVNFLFRRKNSEVRLS